MAPRLSAGQSIRGKLSASLLMDAAAAAQDYRDRQRLGGGLDRPPVLYDPTVVLVRNDCGADRTEGEALEIGSYLLTSRTFTQEHPWFAGTLRSNAGPFGVLQYPLKDGKIGPLRVAGTVMALVDLLDADHTHCYVKTSDANPQSNFGGPWRILYKPSGTGNAQRCLILLGDPCYERKAITDATLTAGSSAACSFLIDGVDKGSETVYFNHLENGVTSVASGRDILVRWFDDEEKWVLVAAECP
jgi:hypothetical protein